MANILNEEDLKKVTGGQIDWEVFSKMYMNEIKNSGMVFTIKHKEMIEAIKEKDYLKVATIALELFKNDATIANLMIKCRSQN